jgi:low affinity Fe/Cu permease
VASVASLVAVGGVTYLLVFGAEHDLVVFAAVIEAVTLVLVFVVQHTQGREQAATQRKLDELIRALNDADSNLIQLEEAPDEEMDRVAHEQRRGARTPG